MMPSVQEGNEPSRHLPFLPKPRDRVRDRSSAVVAVSPHVDGTEKIPERAANLAANTLNSADNLNLLIQDSSP